MTTIYNEILAKLANFLRLYWKYLIILTLVGVLFFKYLFYQSAYSRISRSIDSVKPSQKLIHQGNPLQHGKCLQKWIQTKGFNESKAYIKKKFKKYEKSLFVTDRKGQKRCSKSFNLKFSAPNRERIFNIFPQFSQIYFRYYSILLWERIVYNLDIDSCQHPLQVGWGVEKFWNEMDQLSSWHRLFVHRLNSAVGFNTIDSNIDDYFVSSPLIKLHRGFFLHPADAIQFSSLFLGKDVCDDIVKREKKFAPVKVVIFNRLMGKKIMNVQNITELFSKTLNHSSASSLYNVKEVAHHYFEHVPFREQVSLLYESDVVIAVHGAGLTNLVFMKPCSIVIEVTPWLSNITMLSDNPAYRRADVSLYSWEESPQNSIFNPALWYNFGLGDCEQFLLVYKRMYDSGHFTGEQLNNLCARDGRAGGASCSGCLKKVEGLKLSLEKLKEIFPVALKDRERCIQSHPFYNPF